MAIQNPPKDFLFAALILPKRSLGRFEMNFISYLPSNVSTTPFVLLLYVSQVDIYPDLQFQLIYTRPFVVVLWKLFTFSKELEYFNEEVHIS